MESSWPRTLAPIGLVLLFQFSSLMVREYVRLRLLQGGTAPDRAELLSAVAGFLMLGVLLAPLLVPVRKHLFDLFRKPADWRRIAVQALAIGILLRGAAWCIAIAAAYLGMHGPLSSTPSGPFFWWRCPSWNYLLLSLTVLALLTPVVEETLNRGVILGSLLAGKRQMAIPLSAALFAGFHAPNNLAIAFLFGITAARMMIRDRRLLGPVMAHATFNGLTLLDWDCLNGSWSPANASLPAAVTLVIAAVAIWWLTWRMVRLEGAGSKE
jgi:membrane protease YdiL (CAAX protease family)